jgi:GlpG protein
LIGHLSEEAAARIFGDFLYAQGIENQVELLQDGRWGIWVVDEDHLQRAGVLLAEFNANPADAKFHDAARAAAELRARRARDQESHERKLRSRRHLFRPLTPYGFGPLTFVLIAGCVAVFLLSRLGSAPEAVMPLAITNYTIDGGYIQWDNSLPEVRHGQVWRLFTPMFLHFTLLHILFNLLWLRDLGSMIEGRQTTGHLALLVLGISGLSNLAQFYIHHSPAFGGMSGVVYGLLGYIWIRGKLDPASGLFLHPTTVVTMLVWLVVCFTGLLGPVANTAHVAGLLVGMAWGYLSSLRYR